jgi:hypothetical protein
MHECITQCVCAFFFSGKAQQGLIEKKGEKGTRKMQICILDFVEIAIFIPYALGESDRNL